MPQTPNENLPYPAPADPCDVPEDLKRLASRTDDVITLLRNQVAAIEPGITESDADDKYLQEAAADNLYVNVDGDTMTGSLVLGDWAGALDVGYQGTAHLVARVGSLIVDKTADSASTSAILMVRRSGNRLLEVRANGQILMDTASAVRVPAPTGDDHAARKQDLDGKVNKGGDTVTGVLIMPIPRFPHQPPRLARAPDETTGDLGLPGYAGSSTGLRDIASLLTQAEQGTGQNLLVREGNTVHFHLSIATGWTDGVVLDALPVEFRPPVTQNYRAYYGASVYVTKSGLIGVGGSTQAEGQGPLSASMSWPVAKDWPSTLPGTEVTPPAKWS